jgi:hypothetical protein
MAINKFLGTATAVSQVDTFTPATIEATDVFTLTVTGFDGSSDSISYTAVDTSATTVSDALITLWNDSTASLFTGITASGTSTVILTADVAGTAFKVASSAVDGGGADTQTFTRAATTANGGPSDWSDPANWSEGTIPGATASEETHVEDSAIDILYGLDQSGAGNTLDSLHISKTYTGKIGWNGATGLVGDYLQLLASNIFIGEPFVPGNPQGSGRIKIDTSPIGAAACEIIVYFMASSSDSGKQACRLITGDANTIVREIRQGSVGIAEGTGETSTLGSALISYETNIGTDASLVIGSGVTITTLNCDGGETFMKAGCTTLSSRGGTVIISGTGALGTLNVDGGFATPVSSGTITTCNIDSGTCDFTASAELRTVTTLKLTSPGVLQVDADVVTITSDISPKANAGRQQYRASKI